MDINSRDPFNAVQWDYTAFIVGGGPSLKTFNWSKLDGKFVVAINRAYEVLPNAQIVYFTDADYWQRHKQAMLQHKGQLIRGALRPAREEQHPRVQFYKLTGKNGLERTPGCLRHGSNSTYAALNMLTVHMNFKTVYLLGVDMKWGKKGVRSTSHWHNGHKRIDPESGYKGFITNFACLVQPLQELGVKVYNINPDSALTAFPKVTFEEIFGDDARTVRRQSGETAEDPESGQDSGTDRKSREEALRLHKAKTRAKQVAQKHARRYPRTPRSRRARQLT